MFVVALIFQPFFFFSFPYTSFKRVVGRYVCISIRFWWYTYSRSTTFFCPSDVTMTMIFCFMLRQDIYEWYVQACIVCISWREGWFFGKNHLRVGTCDVISLICSTLHIFITKCINITCLFWILKAGLL